ncbi:MAG: hypothetical protein V7K67_26095 [Nostoc sp.]|uniref:hypothetical protein n=1 Tax=Nostoc sp. TaxID=1180 RepID=UPI002FF9BB38
MKNESLYEPEFSFINITYIDIHVRLSKTYLNDKGIAKLCQKCDSWCCFLRYLTVDTLGLIVYKSDRHYYDLGSCLHKTPAYTNPDYLP